MPNPEMSPREPEEIEQLSENKLGEEKLSDDKAFKFGENVWVQRSSGDIESNWQVYGYDGGNVVVRRIEKGGRVIEKKIPEIDLKNIREEKTKEIRKISGL